MEGRRESDSDAGRLPRWFEKDLDCFWVKFGIENHQFQWVNHGKSSNHNGPFSITMLNYQSLRFVYGLCLPSFRKHFLVITHTARILVGLRNKFDIWFPSLQKPHSNRCGNLRRVRQQFVTVKSISIQSFKELAKPMVPKGDG